MLLCLLTKTKTMYFSWVKLYTGFTRFGKLGFIDHFQVWDSELEAIAQRWADQCQSGYDTNKKKLDGTSVGQNVAWISSLLDIDSVVAGVQRWYDEVHNFRRYPESPFSFDSGTGHYTQLVWADTELVGCGMIYKHSPPHKLKYKK